MANEKEITDLISEMLVFHDCVVVPGFGGFVAKHVPAKIDPVTKVITPPSKSILFNKNLTSNDGLLANTLSERFNFSYAEAMDKIMDFSSMASSSLSSQQRFEFGQIGVLFNDPDKNIQFEPSEGKNFLSDSFGLSTIFAPPVNKISTLSKSDFQNRTTTVSTKKISDKKLSVRWVAAVVIPVCLLIGFFIATSLAPENSELASLNPFQSRKDFQYRPQHSSWVVFQSPAKDEPLPSSGILSLGTSFENPVYFSDSLASSIVNPHISKTEMRNFSGNFEVVVGCFREKNNAEKLIRLLQEKNLNTGITGTNLKGMFVVSAGGFDSRDSAYSFLGQVKPTCPSAWVKH